MSTLEDMDASAIAEALIHIDEDNRIWCESARELLMALVLHERLSRSKGGEGSASRSFLR